MVWLILYVSIHKGKDLGMTYDLYSILGSPDLSAISENLIDLE